MVSRERLREETMKRPVLRFVAVIGAATVSALAVSPAFAAATISQATAQSINLTLGGNSVVAQKQTATNDGTTETRNDTDTVPNLVGVIPENTALKAAVLPQLARAKADGTSFACAGLASDGNGGAGVVTVGTESCDLTGSGAIPLDLGSLALGNAVLTDDTALKDAIDQIPNLSDLLTQLGTTVNDLVTQISGSLATTPLGEIGLAGNLGVISAVCEANPDAATGDATLADSTIKLSLPGVTPDVTLVHLPVHPQENQKVVGDTPGFTTLITNALSDYLTVFLQGQFDGTPLPTVPTTVQTEVLNQLLDGLKPLTDAIAQYLAEITLRETTHGDAGRSIDVTALHATVLPNSAIPGGSLVDGRIGRVTCGPNQRPATDTGSPNQPGTNPTLPDIPTVVDSGVAGHADHTAQYVLGATAALLLLAGTAGLVGYRRMLSK
jgi:hypothetical protein